MPWCPACSRVEPPGGQGKEGAADGGEVWDGLGGPGRLETRDLATQGSGTRAARLQELDEREGGWQAGRVEGWRGSLPQTQTQTQRSIPTLASSQPLGWGLGGGPGVPPLPLPLNRCIPFAGAGEGQSHNPSSGPVVQQPLARETGVQTGP